MELAAGKQTQAAQQQDSMMPAFMTQTQEQQHSLQAMLITQQQQQKKTLMALMENNCSSGIPVNGTIKRC